MNTLKNLTPTRVIIFSTALFIIFAGSASFIGIDSPWILLNENQVLYLFSTSSQVLASIYGLTLTAFIFFRNELSREESEDDTLSDAVENLKKRYFTLLLFITGITLTSIFLSNIAMSLESTEGNYRNVFAINVAQSAFIISLLVISYFIFDVASPKKIELVSARLQDSIDPSRGEERKGSLEEFLRNFNEIENILLKYSENYSASAVYQTAPSEYSQKKFRRISNTRLAEILFRSERITKNLFLKLRELITLRNSIIHGAEPTVSEGIVQTSANALRELK
ncbi:TPA: hypothetical protein QDB24_006397, partial [Burkholderia vietnamiensis]|nr:hypothetical protein [Burkholderia vietnamiensis]